MTSLPAQAQGPFTGSWTVTASQPAPWVGPKSDLKPSYEPKLKNAVITFSAKRVEAPGWFGCTKPHYEI